jgi:hypothetical protein
MFSDMAQAMYKLHYQEAIAPNLADDQKLAVAQKISDLTLKAPIWDDRDTDWLPDFPELAQYVKARLTGLYLCTITGAIVDEFRNPKETK